MSPEDQEKDVEKDEEKDAKEREKEEIGDRFGHHYKAQNSFCAFFTLDYILSHAWEPD